MKTLAIAVACLGTAVPAVAEAMPNPASVFCVTMGGHAVIAALPDGGAIRLCYLSNKRVVEEWTLFRMLHGKKPSPRANPFR